jgi:hypothetical protein
MNKPPKKLLDQVADAMRLKHHSIRTEKSHLSWIKRYILYYGKRHPKDMGAFEVQEFLTHLARKQKVSASTQNQAFSALLFLLKELSTSTRMIFRRDMAKSICPTPWNENTKMPMGAGSGSMSSHPKEGLQIRDRKRSGGIISVKVVCKKL